MTKHACVLKSCQYRYSCLIHISPIAYPFLLPIKAPPTACPGLIVMHSRKAMIFS